MPEKTVIINPLGKSFSETKRRTRKAMVGIKKNNKIRRNKMDLYVLSSVLKVSGFISGKFCGNNIEFEKLSIF